MAQTTNAEPELSPKDKDVKPGEVNMLGRSVFLCSFCGKGYNTRRDLLVHQWTHKERQTFVCQTCDKTFSNENMFRRHMSVHVREEKKFVSCEICKKVFRNNRHLEEHHLKAHMGQKPHKCETCGAEFSWKENLAKHMRVHVDKPFACRICHDAFKDKTALRIHLRSHRLQVRTEKSLQVTSAPKTSGSEKKVFSSENVNDNYQQTAQDMHDKLSVSLTPKPQYGTNKYAVRPESEAEDDDDKPFKCHKCEQAFLYKFSMEAHMKGHAENSTNISVGLSSNSGLATASPKSEHARYPRNPVLDKPHKCHLCEETFRWSFCLDAHIKIHKIEEDREKNGEEPELLKSGRGRSSKKAKVTHVVTVSEEPTRVVTITKKPVERKTPRPSKPVSLKRPKKQVDMMEKIKAEKAKNLGSMYEKTKTVNYLNKPKLNKSINDVKKGRIVRKTSPLTQEASSKENSEAMNTRKTVCPKPVEVEHRQPTEDEVAGANSQSVECSTAEGISQDLPLCTSKIKVDCATQVELDDVSDDIEEEVSPVVRPAEKKMSDAFTQADEVENEPTDVEDELEVLKVSRPKRRRRCMEPNPAAIKEETEKGGSEDEDEGINIDGQEKTLTIDQEIDGMEANQMQQSGNDEEHDSLMDDTNEYSPPRNPIASAETIRQDITTDTSTNQSHVKSVGRRRKNKTRKKAGGKTQDMKVSEGEHLGRMSTKSGHVETELLENNVSLGKKQVSDVESPRLSTILDCKEDTRTKIKLPKRKGKKVIACVSEEGQNDQEINGKTSQKGGKRRKGRNKSQNSRSPHNSENEEEELSTESVAVGKTPPLKEQSGTKIKLKKSEINAASQPNPSDEEEFTVVKPVQKRKKKKAKMKHGPSRSKTDATEKLVDEIQNTGIGDQEESEMSRFQVTKLSHNTNIAVEENLDDNAEQIKYSRSKRGKRKGRERKQKARNTVSRTHDAEHVGESYASNRKRTSVDPPAVKKYEIKKPRINDNLEQYAETNSDDNSLTDSFGNNHGEDENSVREPESPKAAESTDPKMNLKVRLYTCDMCGKAFMEKVALSAHKMVHTVDLTPPKLDSSHSPDKTQKTSPRSRKQKHPRKSPHKV